MVTDFALFARTRPRARPLDPAFCTILAATLASCAGSVDDAGADDSGLLTSDTPADAPAAPDTVTPADTQTQPADTGLADTALADTALADTAADTAASQDTASSDQAAIDTTDTAIGNNCTGIADLTPCDDGEPCTQNDACKAGKCTGVNTCECQIDAVCAAASTDQCLGAAFGDKTSLPYKCAVKPGTKIACKGQTGPCTTETCNPINGECQAHPFGEGNVCDDGDPCTVNGICDQGTCKGNAASWCECKVDADCDKLEDGDLCNGTHYCDASVFPNRCKLNKSTLVECAPDNDKPCITNQCDPATAKCSMQQVKKDTPCDDGDSCTQGDACDEGLCKGGTDTCKCKLDKDCDKLEDGNLCNGVLFCDKKLGDCTINPKTVVLCGSGVDSDCSKKHV